MTLNENLFQSNLESVSDLKCKQESRKNILLSQKYLFDFDFFQFSLCLHLRPNDWIKIRVTMFYK